jgi:thiamine biosynthesis protein ThiS
MTIKLNHNVESFEADQLTIGDIIKLKKYSHHDLIIKINALLIKHENYSEMTIKDGDNVEIIHLFHGG